MTIPGVDAASYQGPHPDFAGCAFVIIKVTEGLNYINPVWREQLAVARADGAEIGFYHFPHATEDFAAQVDFMLATIGTELRPAVSLWLDWETNPTDGTALTGPQKDAFLRIMKAKAPAHPVGPYCNKDFWFNRDTTSFVQDGLWIADPSSPAGRPAIQHPWVIHQYGQNASGADVNVANFPTQEAMHAWALGTPGGMMGTPLTTDDLPAIAEAVGDRPFGRQGPGQTGNTSLAIAAAKADAYFAEIDSNVKKTLDAVQTLATQGLTLSAEQEQALAAALAPLLTAFTPPTAEQVAEAVVAHLKTIQ